MRWIAVFGVALGLLSGLTVAAQSPPLPDIAWTADGELWLAGAERAPYRAGDEGACCAVFSPSGEHLALVYAQAQQPALGVLSLAQDVMRRISLPEDWPVGALPGPLHWQGEVALWVNAFMPANTAQRGIMTTDFALWRLDVQTETWQRISQDGYPVPDALRVAIIDPGDYSQRPGEVVIWQAGEIIAAGYSFEAVSSGSHLPWVPSAAWHGDALHLAIAPPDLVYTFAPPYPPTEIIAWDPGRAVESLFSITTAYPAEVIWSPDGARAAYLSPPAADGGQALVVHDAGPVIVAEDLALGAQLLYWDADALTVLAGALLRWSPDEGVSSPLEGVWDAVPTRDAGLAVQIEAGYTVRLLGDEATIQLPPSGAIPRLAPGIDPDQAN